MQDLGDLAALRAAYTSGSLRPTEVAQLVHDRIAARGDDAVWISRVPPEALHARAEALTGRDAADLPLFGVPFAVKDNIDVAGLATTAGCPDFSYVPQRTAPVVRRLLDAGAMLVGKTNLDQFATGLTGSRSPYGACESALGGGLIAGGSSSGSAVAVAAGLVSFALGTDTAGSGRVPAAMNGIVGLKPTRGLLSTAGVVPACRSLDCVSIFTTGISAADAVFTLARGVSPDDPWSRPRPSELVWPGLRESQARFSAPPPRVPTLAATVRLGVPRPDDLEFYGDAGQRERYLAGVDRAGRLCAQVDRIPLDPFLEAGELLYHGPWLAERLTGLDEFLRARPDSVHPVTRQILETGRRFDAIAAFRAQHRLQELRAAVDRLWERLDALLLPTVGTTFTLAEIADDPVGRNLMLGRYTQFANLLDLAVVTVPNGRTADGRPASLSVLGPAFSEPTLLALAAGLAPHPASPSPVRVDHEVRAGMAAGPGPNSMINGGQGEGGATGGETAAVAGGETAAVAVAVVGRHLTGETRNGELIACGATLAERTRTAPLYRLYRLGGVRPGGDGGGGGGQPSSGGVDTGSGGSGGGGGDSDRRAEPDDGLPALVRVADGGAGIDVEVWQVPRSAVGGLLAGVPAPLSLGWVRLADGRQVLGFLGEAYAVAAAGDAEDISASGGWRAYRRALATR